LATQLTLLHVLRRFRKASFRAERLSRTAGRGESPTGSPTEISVYSGSFMKTKSRLFAGIVLALSAGTVFSMQHDAEARFDDVDGMSPAENAVEQDIHFLNHKGEMVRGKRCAQEHLP